MKKRIMILSLFVFLTTVACFDWGDTLRCTYEETYDSLVMKMENEIRFENEEPIEITMKVTNQFDSYNRAKEYYEGSDMNWIRSKYSEKNVPLSVELDGDKVKFTATYDEFTAPYARMQGDLGFEISRNEVVTKKIMQEDHENAGFVCE